MAYDVNAVIEISLKFHEFYNIDLFHRGLYQIRCHLKSPFKKISCKTELNVLRSAAPFLFAANVVDGQAVGQTIEIIYQKEVVPLDDTVMLKIFVPMNSEKLPSVVQLPVVLELWYIEKDKLIQPKDVGAEASFACLFQQCLQLEMSLTKGLHAYRPLLFDYFHLCAVTLSIHASLLSIQGRTKAQKLNKSARLTPLTTGPLSSLSARTGGLQTKISSSGSSQSLSLETQNAATAGSCVSFTESAVFGSSAKVASRLACAYAFHHNAVRLLLTAYESLQLKIVEYSKLLPPRYQIRIQFVDCAKKLDVLQNNVKQQTNEMELLGSIENDLSLLSAELDLMWKQFLELFRESLEVRCRLEVENHTQRVRRFAEGFLFSETTTQFLTSYSNIGYNLAAQSRIVATMRRSDYMSLLPSLPINCVQLDGVSDSFPILFEERFVPHCRNGQPILPFGLSAPPKKLSSSSACPDSQRGTIPPDLLFPRPASDNAVFSRSDSFGEVFVSDELLTDEVCRKLSGQQVATPESACEESARLTKTATPTKSYSRAFACFCPPSAKAEQQDLQAAPLAVTSSPKKPNIFRKLTLRHSKKKKKKAERSALSDTSNDDTLNSIRPGDFDENHCVAFATSRFVDVNANNAMPTTSIAADQSSNIPPLIQSDSLPRPPKHRFVRAQFSSMPNIFRVKPNRASQSRGNRTMVAVLSNRSTTEEEEGDQPSVSCMSSPGPVGSPISTDICCTDFKRTDSEASLTTNKQQMLNGFELPSTVRATTDDDSICRKGSSAFVGDELADIDLMLTPAEALSQLCPPINYGGGMFAASKSTLGPLQPPPFFVSRCADRSVQNGVGSTAALPKPTSRSVEQKESSTVNEDRVADQTIVPKLNVHVDDATIRELSSLASTVPYFSSQRDKFDVDDSGKSHLIVCVHGLDGNLSLIGNSADLRMIRVYLELALKSSNVEFLMSERNESDTFTDFQTMTRNLVNEILEHLAKLDVQPTHISFVGHSLGTIIIRSALADPRLAPLIDRLHTFFSLNGPHCGIIYGGSGMINMGIWLVQRWTKSLSMQQLALKDNVDLHSCFLYELSKKPCLQFFKNVLLVGSNEDYYVPTHSALIQLSKFAFKDNSPMGMAYNDIVQNLLRPIAVRNQTTLIRYSAFHAPAPTGLANSLIGRAAHIAVLDNEIFIEKLITVSALKYFKI